MPTNLNCYLKIIVISLSMMLLSTVSHSQKYGDVKFYLIDSLELSELSEYDRALIDSSLTNYHKQTEDSLKFSILERIIDNCWNPDVWPKYNDLLITKVQGKLAIVTNEQKKNQLVYFLAGGISNQGFYFDEKGNFLLALDRYHESLGLYESIDNKSGTSTILNNLGVLYSTIGDTSKALDYHKKSLMAKKEINDSAGVAMSYNNIGTIYENSGNQFIALEYYEKSLAIRLRINDIRGIAMSYDNVGDIYFKEAFYGKALDYYKKGLENWQELGIDVGISTAKNNLANVFLRTNQIEKAKTYGIESYEIAVKLGYPIDIQNSSKTLIEIYRHEKNYEKALHYSDVYLLMKDKIRNDENENLAYKKSMQYEYQREALKDSLEFSKEREVQDLKLKEKETQSYALYGGLVLMSGLLLVSLRSYRQKKKDNKKINEQKLEVERQKQKVDLQHEKLVFTHQEISDSINYAKRIQSAILPSGTLLKNHVSDSFIHYRPKDVVSGDFYWIIEHGDNILIAAADCTGHGVPGAMVSVVCHNALSRVVNENGLVKPSEILNQTREFVMESLKSKDENISDGMDISLCNWNKKTKTLEWAGAYNPLYIVRKQKPEILEVIEADRQPVGVFELAAPFTNHSIILEDGDQFYLITDGYQDQFGGVSGKKYKVSPFRKLLLRIANEPIDKQSIILDKEFDEWKGIQHQVDDVCIIGIKV